MLRSRAVCVCASKLEHELPKQVQVELASSLQARQQLLPAAGAPRLALPVLSGKYGPCKLSDEKGQADASQKFIFNSSVLILLPIITYYCI